jgi:predicted Zn-dependent peptidase
MHSIITLDNGVPCLLEQVPGVRSVAVGIWFRRGSRHESNETAGVTHMAEHMLFKGSHSKTAQTLACQIDSLGGQFDAGTGKEFLFVTAKCLDESLDEALDLLAELIFQPAFPKDELQKEKRVILEEIKLYSDDPEEQANEDLLNLCWNENSLSRPILGLPGFIESADRLDLMAFHKGLINPANIVISIAGNIEPDAVIGKLSERFGRHPAFPNGCDLSTPDFKSRITLKKKTFEQVYFCMGIPWLAADDPNRFAGYIVNMVLGGNVSSRLFQTLREQHGLTYSVYSYEASFSDTGMLIVSSSTGRETFGKALDLILTVMQDLAMGEISQRELDTAKTCMKSSIVMAQEGSERRMASLAKQFLLLGIPLTMDDLLERIEAVDLSQFKKVCSDRFLQAKSLAAVGDFEEDTAIDSPLTKSMITLV